MPQNVPETQPGATLGPTRVEKVKAQVQVIYRAGASFSRLFKKKSKSEVAISNTTEEMKTH